MSSLRAGARLSGIRRTALLLLAAGAACDGPTALPVPPGGVDGRGPLLSAGADAVPAAPTGVAAAIMTFSILRVSWVHPGRDETSFSVARREQEAGTWGAWEDRGTPAAGAVRWDDREVPVGVYQYRVRACNAAGCSAWVSTPVVTLPPRPARPGDVAMVPFSETAAWARWTDSSDNETSFKVYWQRRVNGVWGPSQAAGSAARNTTGLRVRGLVRGGEYMMRVAACNAAGCSSLVWSRPVVMPYVPDNDPVEVSAGQRGSYFIFAEWRDPGTIATFYSIDRSLRSSTGTWPPYQTVATVPRPGIFFPDGPLVPGTYRYRIRACTLAGCSPGVPTGLVNVPVPFVPISVP